jgi:aromatic amino acid transport protein AroP
MWASALGFFLLINFVNLLHVKLFGEMEFWFAIIKVVAILAMIVFGAYLLISGTGGPQASVTNLWQLGGFFPHGISGMIMAMAVIMFSFGGLELVGITAAEAESPETTIPQATNQVVYRILISYVGALAVLLSLYPWSQVQEGGSPFVMIFKALDNGWVASALNVVVLTAALSVYNSCVYSNSRMLLGLALQGHAPRTLAYVNARGIPLHALGVSAAATALCVLVNYVMPGEAFGMLMMLVVAALMINWAMICITHLKFRKSKALAGQTTSFRSWGQPWTNYLCLAFMAGIVVIMYLTPSTRIAVYMIPAWVAVLALCFRIKQKAAA